MKLISLGLTSRFNGVSKRNEAMPKETSETPRVPVREDLLTGDLLQLDTVRLCGSTCAACGETSLGRVNICPNCGGDALDFRALAVQGTLWTYTIASPS